MRLDPLQFEQRKKDHIQLALEDRNQAFGLTQLEQVQLVHDSLPEFNLSEVSLKPESAIITQTPFFIAGMTAGHAQAVSLNHVLAAVAAQRGWVLGLGSQRREFANLLAGEAYADPSVAELFKKFPKLKVVSNLGIAQLIEAHQGQALSRWIQHLEQLGVSAIGIHLNALQEAIQPEGTPAFQGCLAALNELLERSPLPVLIKETGCGFSRASFKKILSLGALKRAKLIIDVSGLGGTHWGRIEGQRSVEDSVSARLGETFKDWGVSTVASLRNAKEVFGNHANVEIWASGGVRTGLDAAKLIALGATRVGFAMPALKAALKGELAVHEWMETIEAELKVAMFCTNSIHLKQLGRDHRE